MIAFSCHVFWILKLYSCKEPVVIVSSPNVAHTSKQSSKIKKKRKAASSLLLHPDSFKAQKVSAELQKTSTELMETGRLMEENERLSEQVRSGNKMNRNKNETLKHGFRLRGSWRWKILHIIMRIAKQLNVGIPAERWISCILCCVPTYFWLLLGAAGILGSVWRVWQVVPLLLHWSRAQRHQGGRGLHLWYVS